MYVVMPTSPSITGLIALSLPLPKTAAEARAFVAERNAAARRTREASDRAHAQRQAELKEGTRQAQPKTAAAPASWSHAVKVVNRERRRNDR